MTPQWLVSELDYSSEYLRELFCILIFFNLLLGVFVNTAEEEREMLAKDQKLRYVC